MVHVLLPLLLLATAAVQHACMYSSRYMYLLMYCCTGDVIYVLYIQQQYYIVREREGSVSVALLAPEGDMYISYHNTAVVAVGVVVLFCSDGNTYILYIHT